ncbi:hypothetical protein [Streptococcus mutans]|uniref:hypothetical protein n=1 Tax=Streptococcus mutans TaxID=1309 RepID=UPI0002B4EDD0|nr:hypothetical protein [Streptococcus mutans]EMC43332.1 hypothetical protein SMU98_05957 [Streptococcus mutans SM1]
MQEIKNIYLVAWKNHKFFDRKENPIGSVQLPSQENGFSNIWEEMTFGDHKTFESSQSKLGQFKGGIIKDSAPYQQTLKKKEGTFFEEEFQLLSDIKKAVGVSQPTGTYLADTSKLDGYRFYVIESEDRTKGITVFHFARFIPKYHILVNKRMLYISSNLPVVKTPDAVKSNKSQFSLESIILIEPTVFLSAIYNNSDNGEVETIQVYVHNPEAYEKAFNLKESYFKFAKNKFEEFRDTNIEAKRTISIDNVEVIWDEQEFNPEEFFNKKNVNIAKKFARDSDDDKQFPIKDIYEANEKLKSSLQKLKKAYQPLEFIKDNSEKIHSIKVTEGSVGVLAAIMDGQIWTNEIHKQTQTNI